MNTLSSLLNFIGEKIDFFQKVETLPSDTQFAQRIEFEKVGKVVSITVTNVNNLPVGSNAVTTLPETWRPNNSRALLIDSPTKRQQIRLNVYRAGEVSLYNYDSDPKSGNTNASGTLTYIVGGVIRSISNAFSTLTLGKGVA